MAEKAEKAPAPKAAPQKGQGGPAPGLLAQQEEASDAKAVRDAIKALREDARRDAALGDAAAATGNLIVSNAATALKDLFHGGFGNARLALEAGVCAAAVHALRSRPNSEAVQKSGTSMLASLISACKKAGCPERGQKACLSSGAVDAVISALKEHTNSEGVQECACEALGNCVWQNAENQKLAGDHGCVEALIVVLQQHPLSEYIQREATRTLGHLVAGSEANRRRATRSQGVETVVAALKTHPEAEGVQVNAAQSLADLVDKSPEAQENARKAGAVTEILQAMHRLPNSATVQVHCLNVLRRIVVGHKASQEDAWQAGCLTRIAHCMAQFPGSEDLLEMALECLGDCVEDVFPIQRAAKDAGLIKMVIQILTDHPRSEEVNMKGATCLGQMVVGSKDLQKLAGEAGAIKMLTAGLKTHLKSEAVQATLSEAMGTLSMGCRSNQSLAKAEGTLLALLYAVRTHPSSMEVQGGVMIALKALLIGNRENAVAVVEEGGLVEVVRAFRSVEQDNQDTPQVLQQKFQASAREAGLIEAAVYALRKLGGLQGAKGAAKKVEVSDPGDMLRALRDLVVENYENQVIAGEAGAVAVLDSTLRENPHSESMQDAASEVIYHMLLDCAENQRKAKKVDTGTALQQAKEAFPKSQRVQDSAQQALEALMSGDVFFKHMMQTDFGYKRQKCTPIADVALRGISLSQFQELSEFVLETLRRFDIVDPRRKKEQDKSNNSITHEAINMYQLRDLFLLPITDLHKCSYVEVTAVGKQPPQWVVSHWWGTPLLHTQQMLELQAKSREKKDIMALTYWCCALAHNLHNPAEADVSRGDILTAPFAKAMLSQGCYGTVLLCDVDATTLRRSWCIFESHVTQKLRRCALSDKTDKKRYFLDIVTCHYQALEQKETHDMQPKDESEGAVFNSDSSKNTQLIATMLQDAVGGSWNEISEKEGVYFPLEVARIGCHVDLRQATTTLESDRAAVMNFISRGTSATAPVFEDHTNYGEANAYVHTIFASAEIYRLASEQPPGCVEEAERLLRLKADVNSFVRNGNTPIFAAASVDPMAKKQFDRSTQQSMMRLLILHKADVNRANGSMKTVMDYSDTFPDDIKNLLLGSGAKTFSEAAPDIERHLNSQLALMTMHGFQSERWAFAKGDADTKLGPAAMRALHAAAAAVLNVYRTVPCTIGIQTNAGRHQARLAGDRAKSVRLALEAAGCTNVFSTVVGDQNTLLTLTVTLGDDRSKGQRKQEEAPLSPLSPIASAWKPGSPHQQVKMGLFGQEQGSPQIGPKSAAFTPSPNGINPRMNSTGNLLLSSSMVPNGTAATPNEPRNRMQTSQSVPLLQQAQATQPGGQPFAAGRPGPAAFSNALASPNGSQPTRRRDPVGHASIPEGKAPLSPHGGGMSMTHDGTFFHNTPHSRVGLAGMMTVSNNGFGGGLNRAPVGTAPRTPSRFSINDLQ